MAADEGELRARPVRPELADELQRQFLAENQAVKGPRAKEAVEEALFSGSLNARIAK